MHRYIRRHLPALATALSLLQIPQGAAAQAPTSEATTVEPAPAPAPVQAALAAGAGGMPIVHFVVKNADPNKGLVKLARYRGPTQTTAAARNGAVPLPYFEALCTEPCDMAIDVSERPLFFFIRDGHPVSHAFRLHNFDGHVTLKVRTMRRSLMFAGAYTLMLVVGIPLMLAAMPKVWVAEGRPRPGLRFKRLKRARL